MVSERSRTEDMLEIQQQIYRYCRSMDRMDVALGYGVWHEDGGADYGEAIFQGTGRGFIDFVTQTHAGMEATSHQVSNTLIEVRGDEAVSESYVTAALRIRDGGQLKQVETRGRYLDQWAYRGGRWAITMRRYVHDFDDVRDIGAISIPGKMTRDRSDLSYTVLAES